MSVEFRWKGYPAATWLETDPVLGPREPGYETDTGYLKVGNGFTKYSELPYIIGPGAGATTALQEHVDSPTPHPVYDDGPSFALFYENQKV